MNRRELLFGVASATFASSVNAQGNKSMRYSALALQTLCDTVNQDTTVADAQARMERSIERVGRQIGVAKGFMEGFNGYDLKLVVLPEYWMTGFPIQESRKEWKVKAAVSIEGGTSEKISKLAQTFKIYLCSNHYETDENFPELYFQANVIYGPNGNVVLRYRRMVSLYTPTPYDVWDQYLDIYGNKAIFPVADTEIGMVGTVASEEILYPEIARMHTFNGAEILCHPTSEVSSPNLTPKHIAKKARAVENIVYLVSANSASIRGTSIPAESADGMSIVLDWYGRTLAEAGQGETFNANAILDINALRETRRKTGMSNLLSRIPIEAFAQKYSQANHAPANRTSNLIERSEAIEQQQAVIDRLISDGVIK